MTRLDDTSTRIQTWLRETFPIAKQRNVGLQDSLLESGIIDSLGTLEVVQFLEGEFGIHVSDEEMMADHFESVQAIANFVDAKQSNHGDPASAR